MNTIVALLAVLGLASGAWANESRPREGEVAYQYQEPETTEFYRRVLEAMNISYRVEKFEGKTIYVWLPKNDAEDAEVRGRVSQYMFTTRCPEKYRTTPSTPAGTITRCDK